MFHQIHLHGLQEVVREALTLHQQEKASGVVEDEAKWSVLTEKAELQMNAIDQQIQETEDQLESLEEALDIALELDDSEKIGNVISEMFNLFR